MLSLSCFVYCFFNSKDCDLFFFFFPELHFKCFPPLQSREIEALPRIVNLEEETVRGGCLEDYDCSQYSACLPGTSFYASLSAEG